MVGRQVRDEAEPGVGLLSAEQLTAVKLFGVRERVVNGERVCEPAYGSRYVRGLLDTRDGVDDDYSMVVLQRLGFTQAAAEDYLSARVFIRQDVQDGGGLVPVDRIPGVETDNISEYAATEIGTATEVVLGSPGKPAIYKLNNLFTDITLTDRLGLSARRVQVAKRLAVVDPAQAAASIAEAMANMGYVNFRVVAGDYARTALRARNALHQAGDKIAYKDYAVPSTVSPTGVTMVNDQLGQGEPLWEVRGLLKYAVETQIVFQLALTYGPEEVMALYGVETAMLAINIFRCADGRPYTGVLEGFTSLEGIEPLGTAMPSGLTAEQHSGLVAAREKLIAVIVPGERTVGTAVRVSERYVLLNSHTVDKVADADMVATIAGKPLVESRGLGGDVSVVSVAGPVTQWLWRAPDVGEKVVLAYCVGAVVEYSEVLRVQAVDGLQMLLSESNMLRPGASGAAVISLKDFALLGIFSTKRREVTCCASFSSETFAHVTELESVVSSVTADADESVGTLTYQGMVRRGLQGYLERAAASMVNLYSLHNGVMKVAGIMANFSQEWCTTVDVNARTLCLENGHLLEFRDHVDGRFRCVRPPVAAGTLPNVRPVRVGERVFAFTRADGTEDGVVMSHVCVVVQKRTGDARFAIEKVDEGPHELAGALIVAESDAAVVGQYVGYENNMFGDSFCICSGIAPMAELPRMPSTDLSDVQPAFDVVMRWLEEPGLVRAYSAIGKQVLATLVYARMQATCVPVADWPSSVIWDYHLRLEGILSSAGWNVANWDKFGGLSSKEALEVVYAAIYFHDPGGFLQWLWPLWFGTEDGGTPVAVARSRASWSSPELSGVREQASMGKRASVRRIAELEEQLEGLRTRGSSPLSR